MINRAWRFVHGGRQARLYVFKRQSALRIGLIGVEGWQRLVAEPVLHGAIARLERARAILDDLALIGLFARCDLGAHLGRHLFRQRHAELLS